jgi:predicted CopG family antitoxin
MPKTITLRLGDEVYKKFNDAASEEHRSISNLIETLALKKLDEDMLVDDFEMEEIFSNTKLLKKLEKGHSHAKMMKGRLIG